MTIRGCFLPLFPFKFFDFMMYKSMVFHDIPANRIQHELFFIFSAVDMEVSLREKRIFLLFLQ